MAQPLPKHRAREYETTFIVNPDATAGSIEQITGRIIDAIEKLDGKLLRAENWGKRRLAYPVRKNNKGYYLYLKYLGYSDLVHEIERNLRMLEPVIKYLTVKIEEDVDPNSRTVREEDISFVPQFEEEPEIEEEPAEQPADSDDEEKTDQATRAASESDNSTTEFADEQASPAGEADQVSEAEEKEQADQVSEAEEKEQADQVSEAEEKERADQVSEAEEKEQADDVSEAEEKEED